MRYPTSILHYGSTGEDVLLLKSLLNKKDKYSYLSDTNDNFGPSTSSVVKQFQYDNQLTPDGVVGELTWKKLFYSVPLVVPKSPVLSNRAVEVAKTQLYVRELTGHNDGKEVEEYLRSVGLWKGLSWCQAFVYWCFQQASVSLMVPNLVTHTGGVLDHWERTTGKKVYGLDVNAGDIFVMDYGKGMGHTGIVTTIHGTKVYTVEGNTNDHSSRDGIGVFERSREINTIKGFIRY